MLRYRSVKTKNVAISQRVCYSISKEGDAMVTLLGAYLKRIRLQQGLSLKDVYKKTGISDSKLSRIENGANVSETAPSILQGLSKLYNINLIELYRMAGCLDEEALSSYERVFKNVDLLTEDERNHIQEQIDLFTKGRK